MKNLVVVSVLSLALFSCKNPELEKQQNMLNEAKCKAEIAKTVSDSPNILRLAVTVGMKEDLEAFQKLQEDSTVTCDSLNIVWSSLTNVILERSESGTK